MSSETTENVLTCLPDFGAAAGRLASLKQRLLSYENSVETFQHANPEKPGPWKDEAEFYASLLQVETPVRVYSVQGHAFKIIVKEEYAQALDELRNLRLQIESADASGQEEAAALLAAHPFGRRALPEDLLVFMDELPNSSYLRHVYLLDESNVADLWVRQVLKDYNPNFVSSAAAKPNGDLLLYKRELEDYLRGDIYHEWCHWLAGKYPQLEELFVNAIDLEQLQEGWYYPSSYALTAYGEHWAVYGERMLALDAARAREAAMKAPLRALVWLEALEQSLAGSKSCRRQLLLRRCRKLRKAALAPARAYLRAYIGSDEKRLSEAAARLAVFAGLTLDSPKLSGPAPSLESAS